MKAIKTEKAPAAIGPYSQAIEVGGLVFASGQLPIDPKTGTFPEGIKAQTRQALTNAQEILKAAGTDMKHVVKTTVLLADIDERGVRRIFHGALPCPQRLCREVRAQGCAGGN